PTSVLPAGSTSVDVVLQATPSQAEGDELVMEWLGYQTSISVTRLQVPDCAAPAVVSTFGAAQQ
ncbi:unnamed protein product, partial [Chrysoparadoxa australica]